MGMSYILSIIAGITMTVILGSQVAPSIIEQIKVKKVEAQAINNQDVIFEGVKRYITMKQKNPTTIQEIIDEGFLNSKVNNNGFGENYTISIDDTKGLLKIKTKIADVKAQEIFLKSFKNKFTPERTAVANEFETTFVIPMDVMHGSGLFMSGIPTQDTPPDLSKYKYWYDTSGKETILKVSNGLAWKKVAGLSGNQISEDVLVDGSGNNYTSDSLPSQENSQVGDIKYAYDSATNTIQEYVYSGATKGWVAKGGGGNQSYSIIQSGSTRYWSNNTYASSCLGYIKSGTNIFPYQGATGDGVYKIDPDGSGPIAPFDVYCDMTTDGGGWTLIMKTASTSNQFPYESPYWSNDVPLNPTDTNLTTNTNMKNMGYSSIPLKEVRFCLGTSTNCLVEAKTSNSLKTLLTTNSNSKFSKANFISWVPEAIDLQPNCNASQYYSRVGSALTLGCRFGFLGNGENDCLSPDSAVGFGCSIALTPSGLNFTSGMYKTQSGSVNAPKQGWIFIR